MVSISIFPNQDRILQQRLQEIIKKAYQRESMLAKSLKGISERLEYPQWRKTLSEIAKEEEKHAEEILQKAREISDEGFISDEPIPEQEVPQDSKRISMALAQLRNEEDQQYSTYLEAALLAERLGEAGLGEFFHRMRSLEEGHREKLTDILVKRDIDPVGC